MRPDGDPRLPADVTFPRAITAVTLGVADVARSAAYYAALGWHAEQVLAEVAFVRLGGQYLMLYSRAALSRDAGQDLPAGSGSVTLARNFPSEAEVERAFARAIAAGASAVQEPERAEWGGYTCLVADPDGHLWEFAWNPGWPIAVDGTVGMTG